MAAFTNFEIVAHGYAPNSSTRVDHEAFIHGRIKTSGLMEKCVHWLKDKSAPLFQKIALVFSITLATFGTGLLIGYPILFSAVILVPMAIWGKLSMSELARKTIDEYRRIPLDAIDEAFGGQQAEFPVLDSKVWEKATTLAGGCSIGMNGNVPFIQGNLPDGRPFFGFKVVPVGRELKEYENPTILAIFQRYNEESIFTSSDGSPSAPALLSDWRLNILPRFDPEDFRNIDNVIYAEHFKMIQQIFLHKNHPKWKLAV